MSGRSVILLAAAVSFAGCNSARPPSDAGPAGVDPALVTCTGCHGEIANGNAAPPLPVTGSPATTNRRVGAHQAHLVDSAFAKAMACSECHEVPATINAPGHIVGDRAVLQWGPLAQADGVTPTATASGPTDTDTVTCSNYCHGASLGGGLRTTPVWNSGLTDQVGCGACHGIPPPPPHPAVTASATSCSACHPGTIDASGVIDVADGLHINGVVDVGGSTCTSCHGDPTRQPAAIAAAPPKDTAGNTATTAPGVGAHQAHLTAGTLRAAMACADCHLVPTDFAHVQQPLDTTWGALARTGGVTPTFSASALTCTNYCHGATLQGGTNTAPVWTAGSSQVACGSCHGLPPATGQHGPNNSNHARFDCSACHGASYTATTVDPLRHVNGVKDVGGTGSYIQTWSPPNCTPACHGTESW